MRYYWNGQPVSSTEAFRKTETAYNEAGHSEPAELRAFWDAAPDDEEARDTLADLSGYRLEIFTDEEDEALDD